MNSQFDLNTLSLVHPDEANNIPSPVSNMPFDAFVNIDDDYISSDILEISDETNEEENLNLINNLPPSPPNKFEEENSDMCLDDETPKLSEPVMRRINRGNGKMDYIDSDHSRTMLENAWQAINLTEMWDFVSQPIESFMWSNDNRIWIISAKMEKLGYNGHSGFSFGWTMRNMQYLAQNGEEEFKKLFIKKEERILTPPAPRRNNVVSRTTRQSETSQETNRAQPPPIGTTSTFGNMTLVFGGSIP